MSQLTETDHPWIGVDAIITNDEGEILLVKRNATAKVYPGMWSLPSGKMEWGEEVKEAVTREVKEETGLDVDILGFTGKYYDQRGRHPTKTFVCLPHRCKVVGGTIKPEAGTEVAWFTQGEVRKMELAFDHKEMLRDEGLI